MKLPIPLILVNTKNIFNTGVLSFSTVFNSLLGLVYYIFVAGNLTVSEFGYFSFLLGVGILAGEIGDFGTNSSIIKFAHGDNFKAIFTWSIFQRAIVGVLMLAIAIVGSLIAQSNFLLSALAGISLLLAYVTLNSFIARGEIFFNAFTNIMGNLARLGIILLLISGRVITAETALGAFVTANVFIFLLGSAILLVREKGVLFDLSKVRELTGQILRFGIPAGFSFSLSALSAKLDQPLVFLLSGPIQAGYYSTAQKVASVLPQVASSIDGIFSPQMAKGETDKRKTFREYLTLSLLSSVLLLIFIPFSGIVIDLLFPKYHESIKLLQFLIFGMSFFFLSGAFSSSIVYRFSKPQIQLLNSILQIAVSFALYFLLIPTFGAIGAAVSFIVTQLVSLVFYVALYLKLDSAK